MLMLIHMELNLLRVCVCVIEYVCLTNPIRSRVMKRDKASFVLGVDVSSVLQQILSHF